MLTSHNVVTALASDPWPILYAFGAAHAHDGILLPVDWLDHRPGLQDEAFEYRPTHLPLATE